MRDGHPSFGWLRDALAVAREALILLFTLVLAFNPAAIRSWVQEVGLSRLNVPGLGEAQFDFQRKTLNAVDQVNRVLNAPEAPATPALAEARQEIDQLARDLQSQLASTASTINAAAPQQVPWSGWMFLGTLYLDRDVWKPDSGSWRTPITVEQPFSEIRPGAMVTLRVTVNLRDAPQTVTDGDLGRIITALPRGQRVLIRAVNPAVAAPAGAADAPGRRIWASVESRAP